MKYQVFGILWTVFNLALMLVMGIVGIYLLWLVIKALRVYINSHEVRVEKKATRKSLAEALRENRVRCKMTQEFVSETIGVSRQAVSKWENGTSDPNTSNLIALAKLYGIWPLTRTMAAPSSSWRPTWIQIPPSWPRAAMPSAPLSTVIAVPKRCPCWPKRASSCC